MQLIIKYGIKFSRKFKDVKFNFDPFNNHKKFRVAITLKYAMLYNSTLKLS